MNEFKEPTTLKISDPFSVLPSIVDIPFFNLEKFTYCNSYSSSPLSQQKTPEGIKDNHRYSSVAITSTVIIL
jgi:hypothetical protein